MKTLNGRIVEDPEWRVHQADVMSRFASAALSGLLARTVGEYDSARLVVTSWRIAEAMMEEYRKRLK